MAGLWKKTAEIQVRLCPMVKSQNIRQLLTFPLQSQWSPLRARQVFFHFGFLFPLFNDSQACQEYTLTESEASFVNVSGPCKMVNTHTEREKFTTVFPFWSVLKTGFNTGNLNYCVAICKCKNKAALSYQLSYSWLSIKLNWHSMNWCPFCQSWQMSESWLLLHTISCIRYLMSVFGHLPS